MNPLAISVSEAAKALGRSPRWISRKFKSGEIGFVPQGRRQKLVPVSCLEKWVVEHTVYTKEELRSALDGRKS